MQNNGQDILPAEPPIQPMIRFENPEDLYWTGLKEGESGESQFTWPDLFNKMQELVRGEVEALANIFVRREGACALAGREVALQKEVERYLAAESVEKKDHTARFMDLFLWPTDLSHDGMCLRQIKVQLCIRLYDTGESGREWDEHFTCRQNWAFTDANVENGSGEDGTTIRQGSGTILYGGGDSNSGVSGVSGVSGTNVPGTTQETSQRSLRSYLKDLKERLRSG